MFDEENNSIFENQDDFGVQVYREDINVLIQMNSVQFKRISKNPNIITNQQGDFLGIKTKVYDDYNDIINICINSSNSESDKLTEDGYQGRGEITFNCYSSFNDIISDKDVIVSLVDYDFGIKKGDRFKVEMKDTGVWKGQYSYHNFDITKIA